MLRFSMSSCFLLPRNRGSEKQESADVQWFAFNGFVRASSGLQDYDVFAPFPEDRDEEIHDLRNDSKKS